MTDRELMQQALEALEEINKLSIGENAICLPAEIDGAMDALRERLAQPEQEPVVWGVFDGPNLHDVNFTKEEAHEMARLKGDGSVVKPLYTSPNPEQQKPVKFKCTVVDDAHPNGVPLSQWGKQHEMQPCAGRNCGSTNPNLHSAECFEDYEKSTGMNQWVGLTDEEINSVCYKRDWTAPWTNTTFARAIEAKLREKNHG